MALNKDELLEYLMAYIENEMSQCENEHERIFNAGEFEGILLMLDIFGLDKISRSLDRKYGNKIQGGEYSVNEET